MPSFCGKNNKSQASSPGPYLKRGICHEASLIRLCKEPLLDMAQECMGGWMITAVVSTIVFFIVPSWFAKKKKSMFFIQASLPLKPFIGFLMNYISYSHSYWPERLPVALQTATLNASCSCSKLRHILHLGLGDLCYPFLSCLQWKGS